MNDALRIAFLHRHCLPTLHWIRNSTRPDPQGGSAAYFSLFSGWAAPYPETTGYLIPTLYDYGRLLNDTQWTTLADNYTLWLCGLQLENGAFPQSIYKEAPLVFDTGMILLGLKAAWEHHPNHCILQALERAVNWLAGSMEPEGYWKRYCYTPGFAPAYHSRIVWALLEANRILRSNKIDELCQKAHAFHTGFINSNYGIRDAGFSRGIPATTHTLAYAVRGVLEAAFIVNDQEAIEKIASFACRLLALWNAKGRVAGSYDENWEGNYRFICITGHAQLSILLARLYEITGDEAFLEGSRRLFNAIANAPSKVPVPGIHGGIAGSRPLWGGYHRFHWLNWAAKFYLDAALVHTKLMHNLIP